ncbi:MAG: hypothetical protein AAGK74_18540 [Chloroflexota bacterium]
MSFGKNYSLFTDLNQLESMIRSLESYLKGSELYGSVGGGFLTGGNNPQLTPGAVLMRMRRLDVLRDDLPENHQKRLDTAIERHAEIREQFADRYLAKMEREVHSRLKAMSTFFEECASDMTACARNYNPEVMRRTTVQEILLEMAANNIQSEDIDTLVKKVDSRLRAFVKDSDFVWDPQLEPAYPQQQFWWMYMAPAAPGN